MSPELLEDYRAAREAVAWRQLASRGKLSVTGTDRVSFLHAMLSNDVQSLADYSGRYGTLLTATGKIVADFYYYRFPDQVLIDVALDCLEPLKSRLDAHIIMDDAEVNDRSADFGHLAFDGPNAGRLLEGIVGPILPEHPLELGVGEWESAPVWVIRKDALGVPGFEVVLPAVKANDWFSAIQSSGSIHMLREMSPRTYNLLRLEQGIPLFGQDFTEKNNPLETRLNSAYSLTKGCYPGQEVVGRATHIGGVARLLSRLVVEGQLVPPPDAAVLDSNRKEIGWITSAALSPRFDRVIALAYLKRPRAEVGRVHQVDFGDGVVRSAEVVDHFA
jgi:folate-binding protein YgfZ